MQVAQHDAPVKTVHYIKAHNYTAIMTTSWDKTIKVRKRELFPVYVLTLYFPMFSAMGSSFADAGNDSTFDGEELLCGRLVPDGGGESGESGNQRVLARERHPTLQADRVTAQVPAPMRLHLYR